MKTIVAGSREYNYYKIKEILSRINNITEICIVSGLDDLGERYAAAASLYAKENQIPTKLFPADWNKYGKSAGLFRNQQMVKYADQLIAFYDGVSSGTKDIIKKMIKQNKPVTVININPRTDWKLYAGETGEREKAAYDLMLYDNHRVVEKCYPNAYSWYNTETGAIYKVP